MSYECFSINNHKMEFIMLVLTRRKDHFLSIDNGKIEIFYNKQKDRFYIVGDRSIPVGNVHLDESREFKGFKREVFNESEISDMHESEYGNNL